MLYLDYISALYNTLKPEKVDPTFSYFYISLF